MLINKYLGEEFYDQIKRDESLFTYLQQAALDGVWYIKKGDPDEYWINSIFWEVLGYDPSLIDPSQTGLDSIVHPEDLDSIQKTFFNFTIDNKTSRKFTYRCLHKDGSTLWMQCQLKLIKSADHNERLIVAHQEVSNQRERDEIERKRFQLMVENATDIIVELSADGMQKYISPVVEKYTGYKPHELQIPFSEVIHPDDLERIQTHWQEVLDEPDQIHRDVYRHIHKTKGYVWMEASLKSYLDDPNIQSIICSVRDISERKKAEKLIKESEERYKMLSKAATEMLHLESLGDIYTYLTKKLSQQYPGSICLFVTTDENRLNCRVTNIEGLNNMLLKKAMEISGYNLIDAEFNLLPSHYIHYKTGKLTLFEGGLSRFADTEFPSIAAKGLERLLQINNIYAIGINKGEKLYGVLHFFTRKEAELTNHAYIESFVRQAGIVIERKIMEEKLKESEKRLTLANATKDKFFSIIAHDLRNPFHLLIGFSEMNLNYLNEGNYREAKNTAKILKENAEQGYTLLNNLLEWSQAQQGVIDFNPQYHHLGERIRKISSLFSSMASEKAIDTEKSFDPDIRIYADANMFDTILRNLMSNAIKYTNKGGCVSITARKLKNRVVISVSDNGVGLHQNEINNLFNLAEFTSKKGTNGEKGSGLGLILCKEFVDRHGGKMGVTSDYGKGSVFWFSLPDKDE